MEFMASTYLNVQILEVSWVQTVKCLGRKKKVVLSQKMTFMAIDSMMPSH